MASIPAPRVDLGDGAPEMMQHECCPSSEPEQADSQGGSPSFAQGTLWHRELGTEPLSSSRKNSRLLSKKLNELTHSLGRSVATMAEHVSELSSMHTNLARNKQSATCHDVILQVSR